MPVYGGGLSAGLPATASFLWPLAVADRAWVAIAPSSTSHVGGGCGLGVASLLSLVALLLCIARPFADKLSAELGRAPLLGPAGLPPFPTPPGTLAVGLGGRPPSTPSPLPHGTALSGRRKGWLFIWSTEAGLAELGRLRGGGGICTGL